ncbi:MAG: hypothetical protein H7X89_16880 [Rhizobiales bacterium]|nr:hypothetical protein [Hyphomicrobiales bacterium]
MTSTANLMKRVAWPLVIAALLLPMTLTGASLAGQWTDSATLCLLNPAAAQCRTAGSLQLAQSCGAPPAGQSYCGYYNNECINCYSNMPHYCPPQAGWPRGSCHETIASAQATCGQGFAVCGRPVN